jgi:hypothetical protein
MNEAKERVIKLRKLGKSYPEIRNIVGKNIPKSTLSYWCKGVPLEGQYADRIAELKLKNLKTAQKAAFLANRSRREVYLKNIDERNDHLAILLKDRDIAKIALVMLYLGEGSKDLKRGSLVFGNSDPFIVSLFMRLLRYCYKIDENKFRCTLQCRADQDVKRLEKFWSLITKIPLNLFYRARIDPRTIGKISRKVDYKGVCRIDYFSAGIPLELIRITRVIHKGP